MDAIIRVDTPEVDGTNFNDGFRLRTDSITKTTAINENEIRSSDVIEPVIRTTPTIPGEFNVQRVYNAFVAALKEPENSQSPINTQEYINGYRELMKFFDQLGYVFKFVKDDVVDKLGILQSFIDKDKKGERNFDTIQKGIEYETEHNLIKSNPANFTRTLLRLHRALLFIIQFLQGLNDRQASESTVTIATNSYDATLYHYHGFFLFVNQLNLDFEYYHHVNN